jgi:hypothetical protein
VRDVSLWNEVLGVEKTVLESESVEYDHEQDLLVPRVRPTKRARDAGKGSYGGQCLGAEDAAPFPRQMNRDATRFTTRRPPATASRVDQESQASPNL